MIPPAATASTTAAEVQEAAVPSPITWVGWVVPTARPAAGTRARPAGLPTSGRPASAWGGTAASDSAHAHTTVVTTRLLRSPILNALPTPAPQCRTRTG